MVSASEVKQRLVECLRELHLPTFREGFEDLARRAVCHATQSLRLLTDLHQTITRLDVVLVWLEVASCRV